jgi:thiol-disulfide isomerase/thioredoxin
MQRFRTYCLSLITGAVSLLFFCTPARCEDLNSSSINIRQIADGLVVIVNSSQKSLDDVHFDCSQENNEIVVELPVEREIPFIENLQKNPHVRTDGVSSVSLPQRGMKRIKIIPKLKLQCTGVKMVSKFQRYVTYLYPAGRNLKLIATDVKGFDFDEKNPRVQVNGSINLKFNEPLGNVDLSDAINVVDNTLSIRLNPKDFVNQELISTIFPAKDISISSSSSESSRAHNFNFQTIHNAIIGKVKAKLIKSSNSDELSIDVTLAVSLYETGKKLYQDGDSRKALLYMDAAKSDPSSALVSRMSMGTILWNEDNYSEAVKSFRELIALDRSWEFPDARYFMAKAYYLTNNKLSFDISAMLKEYLRRCDRMMYPACSDARELSDQVNEPALKLNVASKSELKKLVARLSDPKLNYSEVQKNIFHYWATWCPVCLEEMPKIMQYAVAHPNISIYIVAKNDVQKNIFNSLIKAGAIRRKNIYYYIDTKDDILLRQMVPLVLANKEPVTPLPVSVFLQRDLPFYLTDKLNWSETELSPIWKLKYPE